MNRRDFTRSLGAMGLTPLLPAAATAKAVPLATRFDPVTFLMAAAQARQGNLHSARQLSRRFGVDPVLADKMFSHLSLGPGAAAGMQQVARRQAQRREGTSLRDRLSEHWQDGDDANPDKDIDHKVATRDVSELDDKEAQAHDTDTA